MKFKDLKNIPIRPGGSSQVSTNIGVTGIFTQFLAVFYNIKMEEFLPTVQAMTIGQLFAAFAPFFLFLWAIIHNEKRYKLTDKNMSERSKQVKKNVEDPSNDEQKNIKEGSGENIKTPIYKNTGSGGAFEKRGTL